MQKGFSVPGNTDLGKQNSFLGPFLGKIPERRFAKMRKKGFKGRFEKRMIGKCKTVCRTYDPLQSAYADLLQEDENISCWRNVISKSLHRQNESPSCLLKDTTGLFFTFTDWPAWSSRGRWGRGRCRRCQIPSGIRRTPRRSWDRAGWYPRAG